MDQSLRNDFIVNRAQSFRLVFNHRINVKVIGLVRKRHRNRLGKIVRGASSSTNKDAPLFLNEIPPLPISFFPFEDTRFCSLRGDICMIRDAPHVSPSVRGRCRKDQHGKTIVVDLLRNLSFWTHNFFFIYSSLSLSLFSLSFYFSFFSPFSNFAPSFTK